MRYFLIISVLFSTAHLFAQDTLKKTRVKVFDIVPYISPVDFYTKHSLTNEKAANFSSGQDFLNQSRGYESVSYERLEGTNIDFGILSSFQIINARHKFFNRIKPRIYLHGSDMTIYDRYMSKKKQAFAIDSLYYTDSSIPPLLIDSTVTGDLHYNYYSKQFFIELGACYDVITLRYFNFFAGILVGQGISVANETVIIRHERYEIDPYPNQSNSSTYNEHFEKKYTEASSYVTRLTIPVGAQQRFGIRRQFALGIFTELRPGIEFYKVRNGFQLTRLIMPITLGLRLSLRRRTEL